MLKLTIPLCFLLFFNIYPQTLSISHQQINTIKFLAQSTFSDFEGVTNAIEGSISFDSAFTKESEINLMVHLDSLDTGIGLRNSHMREKYLDTEKYPDADFTGNISSINKISDFEYDVVVSGMLKIHGVEKLFKINGKIFRYGKLYKIETNFKINLPDFNIEQPKFLFTKVDNEIVIQLSVYLIKQG